mmetsp:Transcript_7417/g.20023  ORF Transcript_7417/g.20023 Transcript_7417/m.20023 type:complete len:203 (+) Transcript_7417:31-639(+)
MSACGKAETAATRPGEHCAGELGAERRTTLADGVGASTSQRRNGLPGRSSIVPARTNSPTAMVATSPALPRMVVPARETSTLSVFGTTASRVNCAPVLKTSSRLSSFRPRLLDMQLCSGRRRPASSSWHPFVEGRGRNSTSAGSDDTPVLASECVFRTSSGSGSVVAGGARGAAASSPAAPHELSEGTRVNACVDKHTSTTA